MKTEVSYTADVRYDPALETEFASFPSELPNGFPIPPEGTLLVISEETSVYVRHIYYYPFNKVEDGGPYVSIVCGYNPVGGAL